MTARFDSRVGGIVLAAALAGAALLAGCGEGDRIPVLPGLPSLDVAPDPWFELVSPKVEGGARRDAAWLTDDEVFIVGSGGLVLVKRGMRPWESEDCGTHNDLVSLAVAPGGRLLAVGDNGTVLERQAGEWQLRGAGTDQDLSFVLAVEDEAWATGREGTLVHRSAAGTWGMIECPTEEDLLGACARGDTLWVCGSGGSILYRTEDTWFDAGIDSWSDKSLISVAALDEGPVMLLARTYTVEEDWMVLTVADTLYVRDEDAWREFPDYSGDLFSSVMKTAHDRLWLLDFYGLLRLTPGPQGWGVHHLDLPGYFSCVAPRDSVGGMVASYSGEIWWIDENWNLEIDPTSCGGQCTVFRLNDGTRGYANDCGIMEVTPDDAVGSTWLSTDVISEMGWLEGLAGTSMNDFCFVNGRDVFRIRDGEMAGEIGLPLPVSDFPLAVDDDGTVWIGSRAGLHRWDGGEPELVMGDPEGWLESCVQRTLSGTIVLFGRPGAWILQDGEWKQINQQRMEFCGQAPSGEILTIGSSIRWGMGDSLYVWKPGLEKSVSRPIQLVPGEEDLDIYAVASDESGFYAATRDPAWVFRLEEDPLACRWERVAGPFDGRLESFEVLEDGSLLVFDDYRDQILLRRPH